MTGAVRWPLERAQDALDRLSADAPDELLAAAFADVLIAHAPAPFRLGIQFDARNEPCPVPVDKAARVWCTIMHRDKDEARKWIIAAVLTGHTVGRLTGVQFGNTMYDSESLPIIRERKRYKLKRAAMTPAQRQELDDEIPF